MKSHKKEIITVAILMAAAVVIFAGILKPEATQTKKCSLIYIPKIRDNTNDFWTSVISGCKTAAEEYESDLEILAPDKEENIEEQNKLLKKAIEQKPDGLRQTHKNHSPATPPGRPLRRPRKTGPRHRLQIRPRLPKPLRTPTIPPHRNPRRTLLRTLRNGLRKKTKRIPNKNQIPVLIKKSGRNTFLPGFFISISQYTAQKKAAPSKRDCPFHHLIPITSICARIASTHFSNPSFPEFRHRS